jgi:hypothetical protein
VLIVGDSENVSILVLQSRARDNDAVGVFEPLDSFIAEHNEPIPAVFISQGDVVGHFGSVGF